jgi:hypothetical protein
MRRRKERKVQSGVGISTSYGWMVPDSCPGKDKRSLRSAKGSGRLWSTPSLLVNGHWTFFYGRKAAGE